MPARLTFIHGRIPLPRSHSGKVSACERGSKQSSEVGREHPYVRARQQASNGRVSETTSVRQYESESERTNAKADVYGHTCERESGEERGKRRHAIKYPD